VKLAGAVALVTGGAGGIGQAIALALSQRGASVVIADISADRLEQARRCLADRGCTVKTQRFDVSDARAWDAAIEGVSNDVGPIDILCNNAGVASEGPLAEVDPAQWEKLLAINVTGAFLGMQSFVRHVKARGHTGHIVNTASIAGLFSIPGIGAYTVSKFAMVGMSEVLRMELKDTGIGVSVLCPGLVDTELGNNSNRLLKNEIADFDGAEPVLTESRMSPDSVGQKVAGAIESNTFYIITHPEYRRVIEARHMAILDDFRDSAQAGYLEDVNLLGASWLSLVGS
jgi:NAD(P)-dependent dehydrogenase (short-subunit alcohol dehydrogenase family)